MPFEYDPKKSQSNREKHGIDFEKAQAIWDDSDNLEIPAKTSDEPRWLVIGKIGGKCWSGENVIADLDIAHARRPGEEARRINVDFPAWMVASLDREARRPGVTRQSIIKMWLAERLQHDG